MNALAILNALLLFAGRGSSKDASSSIPEDGNLTDLTEGSEAADEAEMPIQEAVALPELVAPVEAVDAPEFFEVCGLPMIAVDDAQQANVSVAEDQDEQFQVVDFLFG